MVNKDFHCSWSSGIACHTADDYNIEPTRRTAWDNVPDVEFDVVRWWRTLHGHSLERRRRRNDEDPDLETIICWWDRPLQLPRVRPTNRDGWRQSSHGGTASKVEWPRLRRTRPSWTGDSTSTTGTAPLRGHRVWPPTIHKCSRPRTRRTVAAWKPHHPRRVVRASWSRRLGVRGLCWS